MNREPDADAARGAAGTVAPAQPAPQGGSELPLDLAGAYRKLAAEKQDLYDRLLRKQAELENVKKRTEREKEEFLKQATADLIRALLPALDSFERALKHRDPRVPADFYKGVELIHREFVDVLQRAGLEPLETRGVIFDPHQHQAVERVESAAHRDQEIVEELQRGYKLKNRLLRPAIVKVAVPPEQAPEEPENRHPGKPSAQA